MSPPVTAALVVLLCAAVASLHPPGHAVIKDDGVDAVDVPTRAPAEPPDISVENADKRTRPKTPGGVGLGPRRPDDLTSDVPRPAARAMLQLQSSRTRRVRKLRRTTTIPQEDHPDLLEGAESGAVVVGSSSTPTKPLVVNNTTVVSEVSTENNSTSTTPPRSTSSTKTTTIPPESMPTTLSTDGSSTPYRGRGKYRLSTTTPAAPEVEHDPSGAVIMSESLYKHFRPVERDVPEDHITPFLDFGRKISRSEEHARSTGQSPQSSSQGNLIESSMGRNRSVLKKVSSSVPTNASEEAAHLPADVEKSSLEDETHDEMDVGFDKQIVERNKVPTRRRDRPYTAPRESMIPYTNRGVAERTMENLVIPPTSVISNGSSETKKGVDTPIMNDRFLNSSKKGTRRKYVALVTRKALHGNLTDSNATVVNVTHLEAVHLPDPSRSILGHFEDIKVDESTLRARKVLASGIQDQPKIAKTTITPLTSPQSASIVSAIPLSSDTPEGPKEEQKANNLEAAPPSATPLMQLNATEAAYIVRKFDDPSAISSSGVFNKPPKSQIPYSYVVGPRTSGAPADVEVLDVPLASDKPKPSHLPYQDAGDAASAPETTPTSLPESSKIIAKAVVTSVSVKETRIPEVEQLSTVSLLAGSSTPSPSTEPSENIQDVVKIFFNNTSSPELTTESPASVSEPAVQRVIVSHRDMAPIRVRTQHKTAPPQPLPLSTTEDLERTHNKTHWMGVVNRTEVSNTSEVSVVIPTRAAPQSISKDRVASDVPVITPPVADPGTSPPTSTTQPRPNRYRSTTTTTTTSTSSPPPLTSAPTSITRYRSSTTTTTPRPFVIHVPSGPSSVESPVEKGRAFWPEQEAGSTPSTSSAARASSTTTTTVMPATVVTSTSPPPPLSTASTPISTSTTTTSTSTTTSTTTTTATLATSTTTTTTTPLSTSTTTTSTTAKPSLPTSSPTPDPTLVPSTTLPSLNPRPMANPPIPISAETIRQRSYKRPNVTIVAVPKEVFKTMPTPNPAKSPDGSEGNMETETTTPSIPRRGIIPVPKGSLGPSTSETESPSVMKDPIGPGLFNVKSRGRAVSKHDFALMEGSSDAKRVPTERELGVVPPGVGVLTYVLMALGVVPLALAGVCTARYVINRRKKVLDESDSSSELSCHRRTQMAARSDVPAAAKLPRPLPHLPPPLPPPQSWDCRDGKGSDSEREQREIRERDRDRVLPVPAPTRWEFPRDKLRLQTVLGQGNFGQVWKAEADDISGHHGLTRLVAVKTVKEGASFREREDLLRELEIMQQLGAHPNVVTLLGCCTEKEPFLLIMEYVMYGKLLAFLRDHRTRQDYYNFSEDSDALTSRDLTVFAYCVARGMEYLASKGVIHRDLAARNVLVDHNKLCKIADFGMSRSIRDSSCGQVYEQRETKGALPIRWMAPESLIYSVFTHKSDVWSFGILMWEIVTLGSTPYPSMGAREVLRRVRDGYRLERPAHCRPELFRIVVRCWHADQSKRPDFAELRRALAELLEDGVRGGSYVDLEGFAMDSKMNGGGVTPPGCHGMLTRDEANV